MGPLQGLRVIEMSAIGPVPLAGMLLADLGAEVVIIDKEDDPWVFPGDVMRRGKRATVVDMKSAEGVAQTKQLIEQADILIEGFRPGVMERLGLGPNEFKDSNPRLIYGRMTGWGQDGPLAQSAGHDINYIALTGALHAIGRGDSPPVPPLNLVGDYGGGTMFLIMGILAALHESKASGKGQIVDAAITEGTANLMALFYTMSGVGAWSTQRAVNMLDSAAHFYDCYETADGKYVSLGAIEPQFYALLLEKLELDKEAFAEQHDPRQWPTQKLLLAEKIKSKTRAQWDSLLAGTDVCFAPVLDFAEACEHPHMNARKAYLQRAGKTEPAPAPRFSRTASEAGPVFTQAEQASAILADWS